MISRMFIAALWSPEGKGLTSWLLFVMFVVMFVTFPFGILEQVWYLIVSIPDPCCLSNFSQFIKILKNPAVPISPKLFVGITNKHSHLYRSR